MIADSNKEFVGIVQWIDSPFQQRGESPMESIEQWRGRTNYNPPEPFIRINAKMLDLYDNVGVYGFETEMSVRPDTLRLSCEDVTILIKKGANPSFAMQALEQALHWVEKYGDQMGRMAPTAEPEESTPSSFNDDLPF